MKRITILLAMVFMGFFAKAQIMPDALMQFNYEMGVPLGSDFIDEYSWAGMSFSYQKLISDNLYTGVFLGFNRFDQYEPRKTYPLDYGAINTDLWKYIWNVPITWRTDYVIPSGSFDYFFSLGIGAQYTEYTLIFSKYAIVEDEWGFLVNPRVGVNIPMSISRDSFLNLGVGYSYATNKLSTFDTNGQQYLHVFLGINFEP
ncbi:MAG: hypothetical protein LPK46_10070 [Bacteroidota bacterium]|nr:hypothetical protein [Bacteroidota bacterium]MDX5506467.1 hypothetical protein [Bacteroidota bacterium]